MCLCSRNYKKLKQDIFFSYRHVSFVGHICTWVWRSTFNVSSCSSFTITSFRDIYVVSDITVTCNTIFAAVTNWKTVTIVSGSTLSTPVGIVVFPTVFRGSGTRDFVFHARTKCLWNSSAWKRKRSRKEGCRKERSRK